MQVCMKVGINTLMPRLSRRHFTAGIFECIFVNENVLNPITDIPTLVKIMAWRFPGDKTLSEPMMVCLPTHTCVTLLC